MQHISVVIVVNVILLTQNEFINGLTIKEGLSKVQTNGDIPDLLYPTDRDRKASNAVASLPSNDNDADAEIYLDDNDNDTNYQFSKEMDMYFYKEFEKLLSEHMQGVGEETVSPQPYPDSTTIADDYISKSDQLTELSSTTSTDIEATVQTTKSYETDTTIDSFTRNITSGQEILGSTNSMIYQNSPTTTSGATEEPYLQSTVDLRIGSQPKDNKVATSSMKPPLSSAGVKISQVEKRLSTIFSGANSDSRSGKPNDDKRAKYSNSNMNEIHGFIAEIQQQTPLIVFGCIMSSIIFVALVFFAYRIMNRLNETTTVALIRHSEHPDLLPPHQQYQVQKLLMKQQMQEEKVVQQRLLLQQQKNKPECRKPKKVLKTQNELSPKDSLELQESLPENVDAKIQGFMKEKCKDSNSNSDKSDNSNSSENENPCDSSAKSACSLSTEKGTHNDNNLDSRKVNTCSSSGNLHRSHCINIIIENGSCLDCIEAVQKRSSEIYSNDNEYATVTYHLGDGVCNDQNHNGQ